jgi:hypothetical protein
MCLFYGSINPSASSYKPQRLCIYCCVSQSLISVAETTNVTEIVNNANDYHKSVFLELCLTF